MKKRLLPILMFVTTCHAYGEPVDYFDLSLKELMQVEITGSTLTAKNLKSIPAAVSVFTRAEIQRMGLNTLDELMNIVPGYQSYRFSTSSLSYPFSSRGRRITAASSEILIMVDGQRLDDPATSGSAELVPKFPLINIERVEFFRGPGAAIYGSNAMMGMINIITRTDTNEAGISYASFNHRKVYALASQRASDVKIDFFGQVEADDGDNFQVQDTFSTNRIDTDDPRQLADLNVKFQWQNTRINLQHNQLKSENFYLLDGLSNGFNEVSGQLSSLSLKHDFDWQSVASWLWLSYGYTKFSLATQLTAPGDLTAISSPASNDALFIDVDYDVTSETRVQWHNDWAINLQSSLQFGLEYRYIDGPETITRNNFDLGDLANGVTPVRYYGELLATTIVQTKFDRTIAGLYAQYQRQLFETSHFTLGLRYDDFSGIGSQLSPRLALVQELNENHSLKLLYGEAFRAPAEAELNLLNNPIVLGNPNLKPETVQSWDLIWIGQWPNTNFSLGYFESHFKNSIVQISTGSGALQYLNVDQDPIKGIEFELSRELNEHWLLRVTYTSISEKPDLSFREAEQLASLMVNYQQGNWNINLITTYNSEREMPTGGSNNNRIILDDYKLVLGKISYRFNPQWQSYVQVKNLLDEDYLTPTSSANLTEGIANRGREILAGITWQF